MSMAAPAGEDRIVELWNDHAALAEFLQANSEVRLLQRAQDSFGKTLIIAAASYFETQFTEIIVSLYDEAYDGADALSEFVRRQAIERKFHTLFDWDRNNANRFYRLFGDGFAESMRRRVQGDPELSKSVRSFLEIVRLRNELVHENYADFQLDKTLEEIYDRYRTAAKFLEAFPTVVREYIDAQRAAMPS